MTGTTLFTVSRRLGVWEARGLVNLGYDSVAVLQSGPVREARFNRNPDGTNDGGVHDLFVITGRSDAVGCNISQPTFTPAGNPLTGQGGNRNIIFRIPTPTFGGGLIENIPDSAILASVNAEASRKRASHIFGHPNAHLSGNVNRNANDGTITRFGWKAQNKSLLLFTLPQCLQNCTIERFRVRYQEKT